MNYSEKLKRPEWQKRRLGILNRDEFTCCICNKYGAEVHAHHNYYLPKTDPWDYPDNALITLCSKCHKHEHDIEDDVKEDLFLSFKKAGFTNSSLIQIILGLKLVKELPASPVLVADAIGNMFGKREEFTSTYEKFKS